MATNMKCRMCGGWGGEYGHARGVGLVCHECYAKNYDEDDADYGDEDDEN